MRRPAVAWCASTLVDAGLRMTDGTLHLASAGARRFRGERPWRFIEAERTDVRFDDLWRRARSAFDVTGEKTSDYLNWRYADFTTRRHRILYAIDAATSALRGYVVYAEREGGTATIEDLFCDRTGDVVTPLLLELARLLRRRGLSALSCSYVGPDRFSRQLRAAGFLRRPGTRALVVRVPPGAPAEMERALLDGRRWSMIDGELDI